MSTCAKCGKETFGRLCAVCKGEVLQAESPPVAMPNVMDHRTRINLGTVSMDPLSGFADALLQDLANEYVKRAQAALEGAVGRALGSEEVRAAIGAAVAREVQTALQGLAVPDPEPAPPPDPAREEAPKQPASYTCPKCGRTSYHPKDVEHRYCGNCHE
jgi:hypothetical protein